MKILAIETSCDDTAIALAQCQANSFKLLSSVVSSQNEIHKKYGGIYPSLARREHQKNLMPVLEEALKKNSISNSQLSDNYQLNNFQVKKIKKILERENITKIQLLDFLKRHKKPNIAIIAVTKGPGLEPCLWTGVNFAKALSCAWNIPAIGINHIEAHIFTGFLKKEVKIQKVKQGFPAIALIASGGHTQLIFVEKIGRYKIIGETRDDAAGEAFDKIARILGLGYPGGPKIEKTAKNAPDCKIKLPRPMINSKNYDFSFSGLKTAVLYKYNKNKAPGMAKEAQQAIIDVLIKKTLKAAKSFRVKNIIIGGGVSANQELRKQFQNKIGKDFNLRFPLPAFSTDNAAMVALCACLKNKKSDKLIAEANLRL